MSLAEKISEINGIVNGVVWGVPMLVLIVGCGLYLGYIKSGVDFGKNF